MQRYHKLTPCTVGKDEWDTKEDTGKLSMKNALYVLRYAKRHSEKIKSIA